MGDARSLDYSLNDKNPQSSDIARVPSELFRRLQGLGSRVHLSFGD